MQTSDRLNFLIMGAQKSGTTALTYFLMQHSEIYIPERKEMHFFDDETAFASSLEAVDYGSYHAGFDIPSRAKVVGEATPIYMYWTPAAQRIKQYNPSIKLIFILRNPIDRAYSHYNWARRVMDKESLPFSVAIRLEGLRNVEQFPMQSRWHSYVDRGYYARQIKHLLRYFSLSQMLFIKTEDLRNNHSATLDRIFDFLGVGQAQSIEPAEIYSNRYGPMSSSDRIYLLTKFNDDIKELEVLLGLDFSDWLKDSQAS
jgi:hypothetical protein